MVDSLLKPVVEMLESLYRVGIRMVTQGGVKVVRARLMTCVFDLVAKVPILNMKQFNGEYGCSTCRHPGKHISGTRMYLPDHHPTSQERTHIRDVCSKGGLGSWESSEGMLRL